MTRSDVFAWALSAYGTQPDYPWQDDNAVLRHRGTGKWYGVVLRVDARKLGLPDARTVDVLNVKCDPLLSGSLRQKPGVFPAYHMNKASWLSVLLDGTVARADVEGLLAMSYALTEKKPCARRGNMP